MVSVMPAFQFPVDNLFNIGLSQKKPILYCLHHLSQISTALSDHAILNSTYLATHVIIFESQCTYILQFYGLLR